MTTVDLGDLTPRDIGRTVTITRSGATITGRLNDFRIDTDWITEQRTCQSAEEAEQIPGARTVTLTGGPWTTGLIPLDTRVEVAERDPVA